MWINLIERASCGADFADEVGFFELFDVVAKCAGGDFEETAVDLLEGDHTMVADDFEDFPPSG